MPAPRDAILEAALDVFREHGYERTPVRMIAERAGVPISTLYAHIKGKEELFLELAGPVMERARMDIPILASDAPVRDKLRARSPRRERVRHHHQELVIYLRDFYPMLERSDPGRGASTSRPGST